MDWVDQNEDFWTSFNREIPFDPEWRECTMSLKVTKFFPTYKKYIKYTVGNSQDYLYRLPFSALYDLLIHLSVVVRGIITGADLDDRIRGYENVKDELYDQAYDQYDPPPEDVSICTECHDVGVSMSVDDSDIVHVRIKACLVLYEVEFYKISSPGTSSDYSEDEFDCTQIRERTPLEVCPNSTCHSTYVYRGIMWHKNKCLACGTSWKTPNYWEPGGYPKQPRYKRRTPYVR
jgi:hypothetical protein